jgi:hypothetical protein
VCRTIPISGVVAFLESPGITWILSSTKHTCHKAEEEHIYRRGSFSFVKAIGKFIAGLGLMMRYGASQC